MAEWDAMHISWSAPAGNGGACLVASDAYFPPRQPSFVCRCELISIQISFAIKGACWLMLKSAKRGPYNDIHSLSWTSTTVCVWLCRFCHAPQHDLSWSIVCESHVKIARAVCVLGSVKKKKKQRKKPTLTPGQWEYGFMCNTTEGFIASLPLKTTFCRRERKVNMYAMFAMYDGLFKLHKNIQRGLCVCQAEMM